MQKACRFNYRSSNDCISSALNSLPLNVVLINIHWNRRGGPGKRKI